MATTQLGSFLRQLTRSMVADTLAERADRELVECLVARPDEPAFEALVRRHGPMVYRVCWRVLHQAQDCEDAFQATFLILAQKLSTVKRRDSLASWLHGVAHRVALDARKQSARRRTHEANATVPRMGPPDDLTWKELRTVLDTELASMPEKLSSPLILCHLEGHSQEEAASQLGWSKSTLKRRLEDARAALGRRLTRKGFLWPAALAGVLVSNCVAPAALSPKLIGSTVVAATCALAGRVAAGVVSAKVMALSEGVVKAMFINKVAAVIPILVLAGALLSGGLPRPPRATPATTTRRTTTPPAGCPGCSTAK
jgi:RNA polymerase sigma factor (sigma-70 family)